MCQEEKPPRDPEDAEIERQVRRGRKFSLAEAIGRLGGGGLMKGASPVTQKRQAELELERFLECHLVDAAGALEVVLLRRVRNSETLLMIGYDKPLVALKQSLERLLSSDARLEDFVNDVDTEWGRIYRERPHFQVEGSPPDPSDPYTFSSVRGKLSHLLGKLPLDQE
jgi:hypothetical protein